MRSRWEWKRTQGETGDQLYGSSLQSPESSASLIIGTGEVSKWSHGSDSNRRPAVYETAALPAELPWRTGQYLTALAQNSTRHAKPLKQAPAGL